MAAREAGAAGARAGSTVTLFLSGDVMMGRGIDQILPSPSEPRLHEPCVSSAVTYVELAERRSGRIPRHVPPDYIWGDALAELERTRPDARIVNLETSVTLSETAWPAKGIHYRMHPANMRCLRAADIDCCALANNHVLDWGRRGLEETLSALHAAGIQTAGAGHHAEAAAAPASLNMPGGSRLLVFAHGAASSGVPEEWSATATRSGVNWIEDLSERTATRVAREIARRSQPQDLVVASIHWGGNWGYTVAPAEREFAHRLIDTGGVDVVHGHSSHHAKGIEVHAGKLILYGCGDLLNDYEGIEGHESFHGELGLMYFATLDAASGALMRLSMVPTRIRAFRIERAPPEGAAWLAQTMERECEKLGTHARLEPSGLLELEWSRDGHPPRASS